MECWSIGMMEIIIKDHGFFSIQALQIPSIKLPTPHMKLHLYVAKSKVLQSSSSSSLVLDKILIPEDEHEDEKYQNSFHISFNFSKKSADFFSCPRAL